jgi:hypothetical protein
LSCLLCWWGDTRDGVSLRRLSWNSWDIILHNHSFYITHKKHLNLSTTEFRNMLEWCHFSDNVIINIRIELQCRQYWSKNRCTDFIPFFRFSFLFCFCQICYWIIR